MDKKISLEATADEPVTRKTLCEGSFHAAGCAYRVGKQSVRIDCEDIAKVLQPIVPDGKDC
jgi:hypothetical protein